MKTEPENQHPEPMKDSIIIPIPKQDLKELFDFLDREARYCDHTLKKTTKFLRAKGHPLEQVIPWLQEHGGYCDCEVMFNVFTKFGEIVER